MNEQHQTKSLFNFILCFLKPNKVFVYFLIILSSFAGIYGSANSYLTKIIIDQIANVGVNNANLFEITLFPAILFFVNYELNNSFWRGINYINIKIIPKIRNQVIQKVFFYVHNHSFKFFQEHFSGVISDNINRIADNIEYIINDLSPYIICGIVQLIIAFITMYFVHPIFFFILFIWVICFLTISLNYSNKIKYLSDEYARSKGSLSEKIIDSISNVTNVRLFSREKFEVDYLLKYLMDVSNSFYKKKWFLLKLWWVQGLSITCLIALMILALIRLRSYGLITIGDFAFILSLVLFVTQNVWNLTERIDNLNDAIGQCNQGLEMIFKPHDVVDVLDAKQLRVSRGEIKFHNVDFKYKRDDNLFENMSVTIQGGQKVGLVGFSGSGKTTFVHLIVRFFNLSSGVILIDDQDISKVTKTSLRENISFISQDPYLFHRSIIENIRYGKIDATDEEVIFASKRAHANEFIVSMPEGYYSLIGERGLKLSGGQKQRISLARTILKNAPILILDEATSALDSVTEAYIQESLIDLMQNKTVVVIAHRLSTLLKMDRILVFDQGKIIDDGTHMDLIAKGGIYTLLWKNQVGGFLRDEVVR